MKKLFLSLVVSAVIVLCSCGGETTVEKPQAGMMELDLTPQGLPISITIPDSSKGKMDITVKSSGATEIKVGKTFAISISEGEGDITLMKSDIAGNDVNKFKRYVVDEPTSILWESAITDASEFHFYTVVKAGEKSYLVEDIKGEMFSEEATKKMLESAKGIKVKEGAPKS